MNEIDSRLLKEDFDFWKAHVKILTNKQIDDMIEHKICGMCNFWSYGELSQTMILVINCSGEKHNFNVTIGDKILMHRDKKLGDKLVQMYEYE